LPLVKLNSSNGKNQECKKEAGNGIPAIQIPISFGIKANVDREEAIRLALKALKRAGFQNPLVIPSITLRNQRICQVCGWSHDPTFARIGTPSGEIDLGGGLLSEIVKIVHRAHETGQKGLNTKDDELVSLCSGYRNPCKAFDDLNHRDEYKLLFFTRKRGLISLNGAIGINRNIAKMNF
jgi:hypothetical protein